MPGDCMDTRGIRLAPLGVELQYADVGTNVHRGGVGIGALSGPTLGQLGDAVSVADGRQGPGTFALHAMPANAHYAGVVRGEREAAVR